MIFLHVAAGALRVVLEVAAVRIALLAGRREPDRRSRNPRTPTRAQDDQFRNCKIH